jgi:1,4-dihydroxy-2-naphthoate octaprenyltransferase
MNRILIGVQCGIFFGLVDVLMTKYGNHREVTNAMLRQAFFSGFALGVLAANLSRAFILCCQGRLLAC